MRSILLTALLIVLVGTSAVAQVPRTISFQGRAKDATGKYPDDTRQVTVRIFDAETGGTPLFSENHSVRFRGGAFSILIGLNQPGGIPQSVSFDEPLWLEITVENFNGGQPLVPRLRFASAPSAMNAEFAESAGTLEAGSSISGRLSGGALEVTNESGPGIVVQGGRYASVEIGIDSTSQHFVSGDTLGSSAAPDPGTLFRDNAPMAWGLVTGDGELLTDFGIARVSRTGIGQYEVLLDNPAIMVTIPKGRNVPSLAPVIQPTYLTDTGLPLGVQWSFAPGTATQDRQISVRTFSSPNGEPLATDAAFSIIIFGRPAK